MVRGIPDRSVPVAQGTGAQRLIEPVVKTASAGWVPALAGWAYDDHGSTKELHRATNQPEQESN
jgi:hypothetical protein